MQKPGACQKAIHSDCSCQSLGQELLLSISRELLTMVGKSKLADSQSAKQINDDFCNLEQSPYNHFSSLLEEGCVAYAINRKMKVQSVLCQFKNHSRIEKTTWQMTSGGVRAHSYNPHKRAQIALYIPEPTQSCPKMTMQSIPWCQHHPWYEITHHGFAKVDVSKQTKSMGLQYYLSATMELTTCIHGFIWC